MYQCTLPYLHVKNKFVGEGFKLFVTCYIMANAKSCISMYSSVTYTCVCSNVNLSIYTWMPCSLLKCEKTFQINPIFEKTKYGCCIVWSYFDSGHNKGVHNGARAMLKQEIWKEQLTMDSTRLQNATNVVAFCKRK